MKIVWHWLHIIDLNKLIILIFGIIVTSVGFSEVKCSTTTGPFSIKYDTNKFFKTWMVLIFNFLIPYRYLAEEYRAH